MSLVFRHFYYQGVDAEKFLQGQVTVNVNKLNEHHYQATAICDLKGRVQFGLWLKRLTAEHFSIVVLEELGESLQNHIKKYGAFSKATLTQAEPIYPTVLDAQATFTLTADEACPLAVWQKQAIQAGEAWINSKNVHLFQPQELRLHQRHGVDYDKGCYLGQEIVARLWFKAQPKAWLHLVQVSGECPEDGATFAPDVHIVNAMASEQGWFGLVVAKPSALQVLADVRILDLPDALNGDVARPKN